MMLWEHLIFKPSSKVTLQSSPLDLSTYIACILLVALFSSKQNWVKPRKQTELAELMKYSPNQAVKCVSINSLIKEMEAMVLK